MKRTKARRAVEGAEFPEHPVELPTKMLETQMQYRDESTAVIQRRYAVVTTEINQLDAHVNDLVGQLEEATTTRALKSQEAAGLLAVIEKR